LHFRFFTLMQIHRQLISYMHFLTSGNQCFEWNIFWKVLEKRNFESWKTLEFGLCKSWKVLERSIWMSVQTLFNGWLYDAYIWSLIIGTFLMIITLTIWTPSAFLHNVWMKMSAAKHTLWLYGAEIYFSVSICILVFNIVKRNTNIKSHFLHGLVQVLKHTTAAAWSAPLFVLKNLKRVLFHCFKTKEAVFLTFVLKEAHISTCLCVMWHQVWHRLLNGWEVVYYAPQRTAMKMTVCLSVCLFVYTLYPIKMIRGVTKVKMFAFIECEK